MHNDPSISSMVAVVVVFISNCLTDLIHNSGQKWQHFGPQSQVSSDAHRLQSELRYNTETLSSAADCGISVTCLAVCQKVSGPPDQPTQAGNLLAHTQEMSQDFPA